MELTVRRTYRVILPDDKDYELVLNGEDYPFAELVDAATREADIGNLDGTLVYVIYHVDEDGTEHKMWMNTKERYDEFVLRSCDYSCVETDMVID